MLVRQPEQEYSLASLFFHPIERNKYDHRPLSLTIYWNSFHSRLSFFKISYGVHLYTRRKKDMEDETGLLSLSLIVC
jgi:hypothetical protein